MDFLTRLLTAIGEFFATLLGLFRRGGAPPRRSDDDSSSGRRVVMVVVAVLAIVASALSLYLTMRAGRPTINRAPFLGLGQVMARETARVLGERGRVAVVISTLHQDTRNPLYDQYRAFQDELKKYRVIEVVATEVVALDPDSGETTLTLDQLEELLTKHATADGLVLFVELPVLHPSERLDVPKVRPQVVALGIAGGSARAYFERRLLSVLVGPRQEFVKPATPPKTPQEWFDVYFEVFTPDKSDRLPVY